MNLKQLEAFVKVAEEKSFSKAAKALFLTQPTVSAHISALEKELSARLFTRTTKEVSLSENGKLLYRYARQMTILEKKFRIPFCGMRKKTYAVFPSPPPPSRVNTCFRRSSPDTAGSIRTSSSMSRKPTAPE